MQEGTPIKSHIAEFTSIINELDKIEVVVEDEDQALLLLCSLPSSYNSFREAIIYGGKATVKINEVKEHLLNKDKIDKQLMGESQQDGSSSALYARRRLVMEVPQVTRNTRISCATGVTRKGTSR